MIDERATPETTAAPSAPAGPIATAARSSARVSPFLAQTLRGLERDLRPTLPRVIQGGDDEAIHDMRVAIRRLRTMLKIARPIYGRFHADSVRNAFTEVHRATGALRDEEVLEETFAAVDLAAPEWTAWCTRRRARERTLRRAIVARLQKGEAHPSQRITPCTLHASGEAEPRQEPREIRAYRSSARATRGRVDARHAERQRDRPARSSHRVQRAALLDRVFAAALPLDLRAMAEPAARFQKRLGEVHDVDVAIVVVGRARGLDVATRTEALARLHAMRARKILKYEAEMSPKTAIDEAAITSAKIPPKVPAKTLPKSQTAKPAKNVATRTKKPSAPRTSRVSPSP